MQKFKSNRTAAEWALRWVWDSANIDVIVSGMSTEEQIEENISIANDSSPNSLSAKEKAIINSVKEEFHEKIKVNCTGCAYCMPCPQNVDIAMCFSSYNEKSMFGGIRPNIMYIAATDGKSSARQCTECRICEKKCPQNIAISKELKEASSKMDKWYLRLITRIGKAFMYRT